MELPFFRINWMKERKIVDFSTLSLFYYYLKGRQTFFLFLTKLTFSSKELWDFSFLLNKQQQAGEEVRDSKKLIITIKTHIEHNNRRWNGIHNSGRQQFIYFLTRKLILLSLGWIVSTGCCCSFTCWLIIR